MLPAEILGRVDHPWFIRGDVGTSHSVRLRTHESTEQLSSLLRRQVEQAAGGIDERLQEHLSRYANSGSGGEPVAEITVAEVKDLVAWLCEQSPSVSATVADDGLMSLFAKLEGDVRLYVEVDRYGNAEAAISRSPTDVKGIDITTIGELTPELVFWHRRKSLEKTGFAGSSDQVSGMKRRVSLGQILSGPAIENCRYSILTE